jgi:hypothetical protein
LSLATACTFVGWLINRAVDRAGRDEVVDHLRARARPRAKVALDPFLADSFASAPFVAARTDERATAVAARRSSFAASGRASGMRLSGPSRRLSRPEVRLPCIDRRRVE